MGIKLFSSGTYVFAKDTDTTPNPNPYVFEIVSESIYENCYLLLVRYKHCTTFKGLKLLLLKGDYEPLNTKVLDPHFIEGNNVIARFLPTDEGLFMANLCAENYKI